MSYYNAHFIFASGANPYISFSQHNTKVMIARCRARGWTVTEEKPGFYFVNDKEV